MAMFQANWVAMAASPSNSSSADLLASNSVTMRTTDLLAPTRRENGQGLPEPVVRIVTLLDGLKLPNHSRAEGGSADWSNITAIVTTPFAQLIVDGTNASGLVPISTELRGKFDGNPVLGIVMCDGLFVL